MREDHQYRIGTAAAISGALLLFIGTFLHPMHADPSDAAAAFAEYAADPLWIGSHLTQLMGVILMTLALLVVSKRLAQGNAWALALLGAACAVAGMAIAGALQAVDGVALKIMVDQWAAADPPDKDVLFHVTFGIRQIEIGLASIFSLLMGITGIIYGSAFLWDRTTPKWLGWLGIVGGIPVAAAGLLYAYQGFTDPGMTINMVASPIMLIWIINLGVWLWRTDRSKPTVPDRQGREPITQP